MFDIGWEVADRTRRLQDMADGIRLERELRDGRPEADSTISVAAADPAVSRSVDAATPRPSALDCPAAERASRPRAA